MLLRGIRTSPRPTTLVSPLSVPLSSLRPLLASQLYQIKSVHRPITRSHSCIMAQAAGTKVTQPEWQIPKPLVEEPVLKVYNSLTRKKVSPLKNCDDFFLRYPMPKDFLVRQHRRTHSFLSGAVKWTGITVGLPSMTRRIWVMHETT